MTDCPEFRPDHNGECLNCDERIEDHCELFLKHIDALRADNELLADTMMGLKRERDALQVENELLRANIEITELDRLRAVQELDDCRKRYLELDDEGK